MTARGSAAAQRTGESHRDNFLAELLSEVRRQGACNSGPDLRHVLTRLGRRIGAEIAWIGHAGGVERSTPDFPRGCLAPLGPMLTRLTSGQVVASATRIGDREVRMEAFGPPGPRPVMVTVGPAELPPEATVLASQAGSVIALLSRSGTADRVSESYQHKARQLRFAVLSALLTGNVALARRMTTGDVPALLDADRVRVHLLHCAPGDRDRLAQTYQDASGYHGPALMVHCPAFKGHLICVLADGADAGGPLGDGEVLRRLVRENPGWALGVSSPHPLHATAEAYGQAVHALAVARNSPERLAAYQGRTPLAGLLPSTDARAWALTFLQPLHDTPKLTLDVVRLAITFPRSAVARLLHISRNTVTTHVRRAADALGLDLDDVFTRAALDLALSITEPPPHLSMLPDGPAPTLDELLRTQAATAWADTFLRPLHDTGHPGLPTTVRTWIDAGTDAQRTAGRLGLSRNTVRAHLRMAEGLLSRDLLTTGSGVHDLVHALRVTEGVRAARAAEGRAGRVATALPRQRAAADVNDFEPAETRLTGPRRSRA